MIKKLLYWLGLICHFASIGVYFLTSEPAPSLPISWLASAFILLSRVAETEGKR